MPLNDQLLARIAYLLAIMIACSACTQIHTQLMELPPHYGLVIGSVTTVPAGHHHAPIHFGFRSVGERSKLNGEIASGDINGGIFSLFPNCEMGKLPDECVRRFAIKLPKGTYEIYRAYIHLPVDKHVSLTPATFASTPGKIVYLGNLHTAYCNGLITNPGRGHILGADISIRDEFDSDTGSLRQQFPSLNSSPIENRLLIG